VPNKDAGGASWGKAPPAHRREVGLLGKVKGFGVCTMGVGDKIWLRECYESTQIKKKSDRYTGGPSRW